MGVDYTQLAIGSMVVVGAIYIITYVAKLVIPYFLQKLDQKDNIILQIIEDFRDTQNHKQTDLTNALVDLTKTNKNHISVIEAQTEVFKQLIKPKNDEQ